MVGHALGHERIHLGAMDTRRLPRAHGGAREGAPQGARLGRSVTLVCVVVHARKVGVDLERVHRVGGGGGGHGDGWATTVFVVLCVVVGVILVILGRQSRPFRAAADPGPAVYTEYCSTCHLVAPSLTRGHKS